MRQELDALGRIGGAQDVEARPRAQRQVAGEEHQREQQRQQPDRRQVREERVDGVEERPERLAEAAPRGRGHARKLTMRTGYALESRIGRAWRRATRPRSEAAGGTAAATSCASSTGATRPSCSASRRARSGTESSRRRWCRTSSPSSGAMRSDYDQRRASVRTWLYAIARNRIIDAHRRAAVRPSGPTTSSLEGAAEIDAALDQAVLRWQVTAALDAPVARRIAR